MSKENHKAEFDKSLEKVKELAKVPKCKLEFRDGQAIIVCMTKDDQKVAYSMVADGVTIEVKEPKIEVK